MFWEDALIDRDLADSEVTDGVASAFGVSPSRVCVIPDITGPSVQLTSADQLVVEKIDVAGDFLTRLGVYLRDADLEKQAEVRGHLPIWIEFCRSLRCRCFVGDDSPSPLSGWLITKHGEVIPTWLDGDELDRGRFVLAQAKTMGR